MVKPDPQRPALAGGSHRPFVMWLIAELRPSLVVQHGTLCGLSGFDLCGALQAAGLPTLCYAVETWEADEQDAIGAADVCGDPPRSSAFSRLLRLPHAEALNYFAQGSIDLLSLDARHPYEALKQCFDSWLPKLAPAALILLHGTCATGTGVCQLWTELAQRYPLHVHLTHSTGLVFAAVQTRGKMADSAA